MFIRYSLALLGALFIYLLITLPLYVWLAPLSNTMHNKKSEEKRIEVSLRQMKTVKKDPPPPMPSFEPKPYPKKVVQKPKPIKKQVFKKREVVKQPIQPKTFVPYEPKRPKPTPPIIKPLPQPTQEPKEPKRSALASLLLQQKPSIKTVEEEQEISRIERKLKKIYGNSYQDLTEAEKNYMIDNHTLMQIITQRVLNRVGRVNISMSNMKAFNLVEFTLYPDGSISDISMVQKARFKVFNQTSIETIEFAHKEYPHPKEPIRVRYHFYYDL
jgi:hypothetical protein